MSVERREPRLLKRPLIAGGIAFALFEVMPHLVPKSWVSGHPTIQVALTVTVVVVVGFAIAGYLRKRRMSADARRVGRWPMGLVHGGQIDPGCDGKRTLGQLVFDVECRRIEWRAGEHADVFDFEEIRTVRVRPVWIQIDAGERWIRFVPASYDDRQRLLWELAVHCNDAVERGIDEAAAPHRTDPPATPLPAAPPVVVRTSSDAELTSLDRGMTGLASALAPTTNSTPAPPRKSGLGVGLFVPPPGGSHDDERG